MNGVFQISTRRGRFGVILAFLGTAASMRRAWSGVSCAGAIVVITNTTAITDYLIRARLSVMVLLP